MPPPPPPPPRLHTGSGHVNERTGLYTGQENTRAFRSPLTLTNIDPSYLEQHAQRLIDITEEFTASVQNSGWEDGIPQRVRARESLSDMNWNTQVERREAREQRVRDRIRRREDEEYERYRANIYQIQEARRDQPRGFHSPTPSELNFFDNNRANPFRTNGVNPR